MLSTIWLSLTLIFGSCVLAVLRRKRYPLPLPPGPRQAPIFGNLKDLPKSGQEEWLHWLEHKKLYGPISSLNVFGNHIIILHDAGLAVQLLERRSARHSSRPKLVFAKMSGWHNILGSIRTTERVRQTRKYIHQEIGTSKSVARFNDIMTSEVGRFLVRVLDKPDDIHQHMKKESGAIILKIGYGYIIEPHKRDPLVDLADQAMGDFSLALQAQAVDFFPILKYLPPWFPGAEFIKTASAYKTTAESFSGIPYKFTKQRMSIEDSRPSFVSNLLDNHPVEPGTEEDTIIEWAAASFYGGGADTTVSSVMTFFLAMALFPEVQHKAQRELDTVLGANRIPQFEDREHLPYINALVKEVFRWHPVVPTSIPHTSTEDDTCEGYFIPKGSMIIANIWGYSHDADIYHDPMNFNPDRFLASSDGHIPERDPHGLVFGFGRRVCPGRTLADTNVFLTIAQALSVFGISKPMQNGVPQDIDVKFTPGIISHPSSFKVSVQPRSDAHRELIRSLEQLYSWEPSDAEHLVVL